MVRGDFDDPEDKSWYSRSIGYAITLLANVILLNLIVAIMGDIYEETITSISEKLLKEQNYMILRNEALVFSKVLSKDFTCLVWMEYI